MAPPNVLKFPFGSFVFLLGQQHLYPRHLSHLGVYRHPAEGLQLVVIPDTDKDTYVLRLKEISVTNLIVLS